MTSPKPVPAVAAMRAYRRTKHPAPIDLYLDGNEGPPPPASLLNALPEAGPEALRRYPSAAGLEADLATRLGLEASEVLVTAGADDALDRICRAYLCPGRNLVMPAPTFEMLPRYAALAGGEVKELPWPQGPYPTDEVLAAVDENTTAIAMVTPNNPTGGVATSEDLRRVAEGAPGAVIILDLAYGEFADEDLAEAARKLPNVVVTRTLSKAWGMAGLRVGYATGSDELIGCLRRSGQPYAASAPSLLLAEKRLAAGELDDGYVTRVRGERRALRAQLTELGVEAQPSQANFVLARTSRRGWVADGLAGLGIAVRAWPGHRLLDDALRITCPGDDAAMDRLKGALASTLAPQALLFDLDGVIADVRGSYRQAIIETAASFEVAVTNDDIARIKEAGDANNDWVVTQRLLAEAGREAPFDAVTERFEALYQGGLWKREGLLGEVRAPLTAFAERFPLAIVTGRPRGDAERFLQSQELGALFGAVICMEDAALKPDPAPVRLALAKLGVERAWMLGDTPDDLRAARGAGVVPLGFDAMDVDADTLLRAGAARVLSTLDDLAELLP